MMDSLSTPVRWSLVAPGQNVIIQSEFPMARALVLVVAAFFTGASFMSATSSKLSGAELPDASTVALVKVLEVPNYCEGIVFDQAGNGYISHKDTITRFSPEGESSLFAKTGAPNGHKILADGTHLVCDASHHAVLHLDGSGKMLEPASKECNGKPLRGPNDLTLDPQGGFYFTDPGESGIKNPIGTVHYVDPQGKTHLVAEGLAYPNGIVLVPGGMRLLVAESQKNRVLEYEISSPGTGGAMKIFADLPTRHGEQIDNQPDGMCLDAAGNLYVAHYGMRQVQVLDPNGRLIRRYPAGNLTTSNVAFGGPNMDQLFITGGLSEEAGRGGLFRLNLGVKGLSILPRKN
jgi:gluconolactonase